MNELIFSFGEYRLDAARRLLSHESRGTVAVTPRAFDTLLYLVRHPCRLVSKRELMDAVWGDTVVEENNLTQTISTLRQLLGEKPGEHRFIVTAPGQGYRFTARVATAPEEPPPADAGLPAAGAEWPAVPSRGADRWPIALPAAAVLLALLGAIGWHLHRSSGLSQSRIHTIAVLPFRPIVPAMSNPALEFGMADTLITRLSGGGQVIVRPLSSVRRFAGLEQDPQAAGRELGVDAVLEGSIQRQGEALRVTTRLIRVSDGSSLWIDKIDQNWSGVFEVQDAIAERVAKALALPPTDIAKLALTRRYTHSQPAYQLYLLGRYHLYKLTLPEINKGIEYFQQAIALEAGYALPYAGLAEAQRTLTISSDAPPSALIVGKAAALKALAIEPQLDEAWATLCFIQTWSDWDWAGAEDSCKRSLAINANSAEGHRAYAILLSDLGRHDEAMEQAHQASQLDPLSPITNALEAHVLHYAGRDTAALQKLKSTLELEPNFWITHLFLGKVYLGLGDLDRALASFEVAQRLSLGNSEALSMVGYTQARRADRAGAEQAIELLMKRDPAQFIPAFNIAMIHAGLGNTEAALDWLEKAYASRDVRLTFLRVEKKWDSLRGQPRFAQLLAKMRLN